MKAREFYQKAEKYLKEAIDINPNFRPPRSYLVAVYVESGRDAEAEALWAKYPDMRGLIGLEGRRRVAPYKEDPADNAPRFKQLWVDALSKTGSKVQ